MLTIVVIELVGGLVLLTFLAIISFELWLVQLALTIIVRTPLLRTFIPIEVEPELRGVHHQQRGPFWMMGRRARRHAR